MGNKEKQTYVKEQITKAFLELLEEKEIKEISNEDITNRAGVGRVSLYRNYENKEDIVKQYIIQLISNWQEEYERNFISVTHTNVTPIDVEHMWGNLFAFLKQHSDFFILLQKRNILYLVLDTLKIGLDPMKKTENMEAYLGSFLVYGLYGWIEAWISRGMVESSEVMAESLRAYKVFASWNQMKD